ncbi:hypothetical protein HPB47_025499 [Ixodes persulcatus]|uniref:Uncharacterized protein n=1 Tax=Ixodes persulcatus TaxID=34615 RepID=A0AC60Q1H7_IXOPE|nr:hypothetical protein HPB47_025499 [Ixodes persulcatus]
MTRSVLCVFLAFTCFVAMTKSMPACPECGDVECPLEDDCPHGVVSDMCGCCEICASGPGEECGGYWNHGGICTEGLTCRPNSMFSQLPGQCVFPADLS